MINDRPDKFQRTPMKEAIERIYLEATTVSNSLRNILMCRCPGAKEIEYRKFNTAFGYLFDITHHKKDLNKELINRCQKWSLTPRSTASKNNIIGGLKLYDEYVAELFRLKVLTYD